MLYESLAEEDATAFRAKYWLALDYHLGGSIRRNCGDLDGARRSFEHSRGLLEQLLRDDPNRTKDYQTTLASNSTQLQSLTQLESRQRSTTAGGGE
jgi:hypothetical protein